MKFRINEDGSVTRGRDPNSGKTSNSNKNNKISLALTRLNFPNDRNCKEKYFPNARDFTSSSFISPFFKCLLLRNVIKPNPNPLAKFSFHL